MKDNCKKIIQRLSWAAIFLLSFNAMSQSVSRWVDMLSYRHITGISSGNGKVMAATENAMFIYDKQSGEFEKFSTIQGLSGEKNVAYYYHAPTGKHFLAHENGKIEVILPDGSVFKENSLYVSFIPENDKIIRNITADDRYLYLAMNFGVTAYDMENMEFGDTYYIGFGGMDIQVNSVAVFDGYLYAATEGEGIKYIALDNPHKMDYNQWQQINDGNWRLLQRFNGHLYGVKYNMVFEINSQGVSVVYHPSARIKMITANTHSFYIAHADKVIRLDNSFNMQEQYLPTATYSFGPTALYADDENVYIGTEQSGILFSPAVNGGTYTAIFPNSPLMNIPFASDVYNGYIWTVYGDYNSTYNPYPLDRRGISLFYQGRWKVIPYEDFQAVSLTDVKIRPSDTSVVYVGSYHDGLLEFHHGELFMKYDSTNAPFPPIIVDSTALADFRISPLIFDKDENLWMYQGAVKDAIHELDRAGNWFTYSLDSLVTHPEDDAEGVAQMDFDHAGNLWLATHKFGAMGLNLQTREFVMLTTRNGIPYESGYYNTQATAVDKNNILWIGTLNGLRILRDPERAFTNPYIQTEKIVVELEELEGQDNQGTELLMNTEITEIIVDGANNKWIGTNSNGVFYLSEDGQKTIYHFTAENSPLPSNSIRDIAVDPVTGLVLFSTANGLIGFKGDASEGTGDLSKAYVYPNPALIKRHEYMIIRNLMSDISVKITDIEGNLVYETRSKGGSVRWDLTNFAGQKVASGVYLIFLTDREGENTKVIKALIIK